MSDNYLRLIPTDPTWRPDRETAERAAALLGTLLPGADSVEAELYAQTQFIDQGANLESVTCPACHATLDLDRWSEQLSAAAEHAFTRLALTTDCCGTTTTLNDLVYAWPAGFARAELSVLNPPRTWLTAAELDRVAAVLGHPLRQVMAHY